MKDIGLIKEFKDIDTYYEVSNLVDSIFQDRVEAHKHLVMANKEIERLHSIIKEAREYIKEEALYSNEWKTCCDDLYCKDCDKLLEILERVNNEK